MAADKHKLGDDDILLDDDTLFDDDFGDEDPISVDFSGFDVSEEEQIGKFVSKSTMVRCERYNANLTAQGCQRKKEALPPRVKNAAAVDDENIQNHPCFGCVGPIVINWQEGRPAILLKRVERKSLISHPYFDNSLYRHEVLDEDELLQRKEKARQVQLERERELMESEAVPFDEDIEVESAVEEAEVVEEPVVEVAPVPEPVEEEEKPKARAKKSKKTKESRPSKKKNEVTVEAPEKEEKPEQLSLGLEVKEEKPKKAQSTKAKTTKAKTAKSTKEAKPKKSETTVAKTEETSSEEHEPCADCGRAYEGKYTKHWRGEICNPCYAKRLRERKKQKKSQQEKPKKDAGTHPPCADCGRAYEGKYTKHWRGEICNPCYAKRLREKKKKK